MGPRHSVAHRPLDRSGCSRIKLMSNIAYPTPSQRKAPPRYDGGAASKCHSGCLNRLHAGQVPAIACVDAQHVVFVDETGNVELEPVSSVISLVAPVAVSPKPGRGFDHPQVDRDR